MYDHGTAVHTYHDMLERSMYIDFVPLSHDLLRVSFYCPECGLLSWCLTFA